MENQCGFPFVCTYRYATTRLCSLLSHMQYRCRRNIPNLLYTCKLRKYIDISALIYHVTEEYSATFISCNVRFNQSHLFLEF